MRSGLSLSEASSLGTLGEALSDVSGKAGCACTGAGEEVAVGVAGGVWGVAGKGQRGGGPGEHFKVAFIESFAHHLKGGAHGGALDDRRHWELEKSWWL